MVVAVRIRPLSTKELDAGQRSCVSVVNGQTIAIKKSGDPTQHLRSQQQQLNEYGFDSVFDESSTQQEVYASTAQPFVPSLLKGLNVTVFAYGATGAGKTHTMLGNTRCDESSNRVGAEGGIIPNTVADLFVQIESKRESASHGETWTVTCTFVEIYNEQVYDLLEPNGRVLQLREDQEKGIVVVAGVNETVANTAKAVMDLLSRGNGNRKTEATMANQVSSRSHAVLQLTLRHCKRVESGREIAVESKLSLIDLAGSERASATNNRGARLLEGANINKSLLALANCINALASNAGAGGGAKRTNVKYRDSRLTHLLKSSLEGGNCCLVMIANINPSDATFEDSHNTLKYANRAKNINSNIHFFNITYDVHTRHPTEYL
jgi:kinesin family protein 18/19